MDQATGGAFSTEFERRTRLMLGAPSDAAIRVETDRNFTGCETCGYEYTEITVIASTGQRRTFDDGASMGGNPMLELFAALDQVKASS